MRFQITTHSAKGALLQGFPGTEYVLSIEEVKALGAEIERFLRCRLVRLGKPNHACSRCGKLRARDEDGHLYTVCDAC